jgi:5'-3' exonuclease
MNHIIHSCTHAHVAKDRPEISTAEMFAGMAAYLQQLLDLLEPRCALQQQQQQPQ